MTHVDGVIEALVDGTLGEPERAAALSHIEGCQSCRVALAVAQAIPRLLDPEADPPAPVGLAEAVIELTRKRRRRPRRSSSLVLLAAALAAGAVAGGGVLAIAGGAAGTQPADAFARLVEAAPIGDRQATASQLASQPGPVSDAAATYKDPAPAMAPAGPSSAATPAASVVAAAPDAPSPKENPQPLPVTLPDAHPVAIPGIPTPIAVNPIDVAPAQPSDDPQVPDPADPTAPPSDLDAKPR